MNKMQVQVKEFYELMQRSSASPGFATPEALVDMQDYPTLIRFRLIHEELDEFLKACMQQDPVEVVDAICDLLYATFGAAVCLGVDIEGAFNLVHESNLKKAGGPTDHAGKIQKPEGWKPPDIAGWLTEHHGYRA